MSDDLDKKDEGGVDYYNAQTGKMNHREVKAFERLTARTEKYKAEGLSDADARDRAMKELRDNARGDWRA